VTVVREYTDLVLGQCDQLQRDRLLVPEPSPPAGTASETPTAAGTSTYTLTCTGSGGRKCIAVVTPMRRAPAAVVMEVLVRLTGHHRRNAESLSDATLALEP